MFLVLFDCDGTIIDSQHLIVEAMGRTFSHFRLPRPSREDVASVIGLSLPYAIARLMPIGSGRDLDDLVSTYRETYAGLRRDPKHCEKLYPGAREVITALGGRDDVLLGIATGKSRRGVQAMFDATGLGDWFQTIQTADDAPSKPDPTMVRRALRETGIEAAHTVVVGDTGYDIAMARSAGATGVGVAWGYQSTDQLFKAGAVEVVENFPALLPLLDDYFATGAFGS